MKNKKYYCLNCGIAIHYTTIFRGHRCKSCGAKHRKNPSYYIHGETTKQHYCIICNNKISYNSFKQGSKKCKSCSHKGKKLSVIHKKRISETRIKKKIAKGKNNPNYGNPRNIKGINSPRYGKISHGKWCKYQGYNMRSSYELIYAQWLNQNNIKWLYESKTFDLGNTTYTPDFYLPEQNIYIEVKGYWRDDAKKKFNKFKRLYSNIRIFLICAPDINRIKQDLK